MTNQIFTDEEAATLIERLSPGLAQAIKNLVARGENPKHIATCARSVDQLGLIAGLTDQAANYYRRHKDELGD